MAYNPSEQRTGQWGLEVSCVTRQFNKRIDNLLSYLSSEKGAAGLLKIGFECLRSFILKTPVLTGRCRAGWFFATERVAGALGRSWRGPGGTATPERAEGYRKGRYEQSLSGFRKWIKITNGVAYAIVLEYGYSDKSPLGMVRITLQQMMREVPDVVIGDVRAMWTRSEWTDWRASGSGMVPMKTTAFEI